MGKISEYNWPELIPDLPEDVTKPLEILSEGGQSPVSLEEIDMNALGEKGRNALEELMPLVINWLNEPTFLDNFETVKDRAVWEDHIVETYGGKSVENDFRRSNRLRINSMGNVMQNLQIFLMQDEKAFTPEEKENFKARIQVLHEKSHTVGKFLFNRYETNAELRDALDDDPHIFIENGELQKIAGDRAPLKIIQDLLMGMCKELEEITLHMLEKLKK